MTPSRCNGSTPGRFPLCLWANNTKSQTQCHHNAVINNTTVRATPQRFYTVKNPLWDPLTCNKSTPVTDNVAPCLPCRGLHNVPGRETRGCEQRVPGQAAKACSSRSGQRGALCGIVSVPFLISQVQKLYQ